MSGRARAAVALVLAVLVWAGAVDGPPNVGISFGILGVLGIFAVSEQRLKPSRRRNTRG